MYFQLVYLMNHLMTPQIYYVTHWRVYKFGNYRFRGICQILRCFKWPRSVLTVQLSNLTDLIHILNITSFQKLNETKILITKVLIR